MSHGVGSLLVVDQGEEAFLDLVLAVTYDLRLYTTDVTTGLTPSQIDALDETDFTEATFAGYSAAALTGGSWTTTPTNPSTGVYATQSFVRSSTGTAENVWGYYITRASDGALMWFEQFAAPVVMEFVSDQLDITPRITLDDAEGNAVETGTITAFGGATAPTGWLLCDGSAVSRTTYADLFAVLGTAYGVGDGSTTFNVPDLRQRFPLGKAASGTGAALGDEGGAINHVHGLDTTSSGAHLYLAASGNPIRERRKTLASYTTTHEVSNALSVVAGGSGNTLGTALTGDSDGADPPYQVVNFIVKT